MINEHDINDWDKESQEAYLKWAKEYGVQHEPWIGQPTSSAAWKAAVEWAEKRIAVKLGWGQWGGRSYD
jgi:hypothetical protein